MKIRIDGQKLAAMTMRRKMTQEELIQTSNVCKATISSAANGRMVRAETAARICEALNCSIDEIMAS